MLYCWIGLFSILHCNTIIYSEHKHESFGDLKPEPLIKMMQHLVNLIGFGDAFNNRGNEDIDF